MQKYLNIITKGDATKTVIIWKLYLVTNVLYVCPFMIIAIYCQILKLQEIQWLISI